MNKRLLLVFFVSKRKLVIDYENKKKNLLKRGQTLNPAWLVVAVDGKEDKL